MRAVLRSLSMFRGAQVLRQTQYRLSELGAILMDGKKQNTKMMNYGRLVPKIDIYPDKYCDRFLLPLD